MTAVNTEIITNGVLVSDRMLETESVYVPVNSIQQEIKPISAEKERKIADEVLNSYNINSIRHTLDNNLDSIINQPAANKSTLKFAHIVNTAMETINELSKQARACNDDIKKKIDENNKKLSEDNAALKDKQKKITEKETEKSQYKAIYDKINIAPDMRDAKINEFTKLKNDLITKRENEENTKFEYETEYETKKLNVEMNKKTAEIKQREYNNITLLRDLIKTLDLKTIIADINKFSNNDFNYMDSLIGKLDGDMTKYEKLHKRIMNDYIPSDKEIIVGLSNLPKIN